MSNDLSPHSCGENSGGSADSGFPLGEWDSGLLDDWLGSEGDGGQDIHDEVHPEKLNNVERYATESHSTDESEGDQ